MSVALGVVAAPSRTLVLAMGSWIDDWDSLGDRLSVRATRIAASGGGHIQDWQCEAVTVSTGPGPLRVTAQERRAMWDPVDTIAQLEVDLDLPWAAVSTTDEPVGLGDLPIDACGMAVGDAVALDSWVGFLHNERSIDGLADLLFWGKGQEAAKAHFGGDWIARFDGDGTYGWLDLPIEVARQRSDEINEWAAANGHYQHMASVQLHSHVHLAQRAGWDHPLGAGLIDVGGCPILYIRWNAGEHNMRHEAGRSGGQTYPVTLEPVSDRAVLRWTIPPPEPSDNQ